MVELSPRRWQTKLNVKWLIFLTITFVVGSSTAIAIARNSKQVKNKAVSPHSLPIKETTNLDPPPSSNLLPMPIGQIELATKKVASDRNPFQLPSNLESNNLDVINSEIKFSGIAQSGDSVVAMLKTDQGQKTYKVGDSLGNGFIIKSISTKDVSVDISNGSRNYRLSLDVLKK
tara:strand:- start:288 stop:809 length:522 start_codon:yes stop_codon:yes gene_type:complete